MKTHQLLKGRESAWVVKGRANQNDLAGWFELGGRQQWVTRRPPRNWLEGDLVFMWKAAPSVEMCGIAEIVRIEPQSRNGNTFFELRFLTTLFDHPLSMKSLRLEPALKGATFLKSGAAGTVFPLTTDQAARLIVLAVKANRRLSRELSVARRPPNARTSTKGLALSVRQPWAELILQGEKLAEYRSIATHKRGRVLLYASSTTSQREQDELRRRRLTELRTGVIVGSVEIVGCRQRGPNDFAWILKRPSRASKPWKPSRQPQPIYFRAR